MTTQNGDKTDVMTLNKKSFLSELGKNKNLTFAADFAKTQKGGYLFTKLFGGILVSKKTSKRVSKKRVSKKSVSKK